MVNPYESPRGAAADPMPQRRVAKTTSVSNLVGLTLTCFWLAALVQAGHSFQRIYADFKLDLPWYSSFFSNLWVIAGMGALFMLWFFCGAFARSIHRSRAMGHMGLISLAIAGVVIIIALFMPLIVIVDSIQ